MYIPVLPEGYFSTEINQGINNKAAIAFSNAVILNPSFSLALSRFLLTITTP